MFSWLKRKLRPVAQQRPAQTGDGGDEEFPRYGTKVRVAFVNGDQTWEEEADLVRVLARILEDNGHRVAALDDRVVLAESGMALAPNLCGFQPLDDGGVRTATIIGASHPTFCAATEVFEYQHSTGATIEASVASGFDQWREVDLPVLLDALREKPSVCTTMEMAFPAAEGKPARTRRGVLGPVAHFRQHPPEPGRRAGTADDEGESGRHDFCPCCLFTNSLEAFKEMLESDGFYAIRFYAIRFYAARDADGAPQADCRVNGEDWDAGKAGLLKYVATWPQAGFEFRKQYVVLQSIPPRPQAEGDATAGAAAEARA